MSQTQNPVTPTWEWMTRRPVRLLGLGFGTGLAKSAPGTIGSLPAVFVAGLLYGMGLSHFGLLILSFVLFAVGIHICNTVGEELGCEDYRGIVWDEFTAMLMVFACIPQGWGWWLLGFLVFRFFDIVKPQPVKWADAKVKGGLGVMLDDAVAAACTVVVIQLLYWIVG